MQNVATIAQARALIAALPRPLGFVPTMGALHEGHLELVRMARAGCRSVVASIFVNPMQFGPSEDLAAYPRDLDADREQLEGAAVDVLFAPDAASMYPSGFTTYVDVGALGDVFEGVIRPHHFRGVATVITKLLHIVQPDVLYLGRKDAQQAAVLRRMLRDLDVPVELAIVPTMRDADGLAMSSRNGYLDAAAREEAPALYRALLVVHDALARGASKHDAIAAGRNVIGSAAQLDYLDVVDAESFQPIESLRPPAYVIGAMRLGRTRLIDNLFVDEVGEAQ